MTQASFVIGNFVGSMNRAILAINKFTQKIQEANKLRKINEKVQPYKEAIGSVNAGFSLFDNISKVIKKINPKAQKAKACCCCCTNKNSQARNAQAFGNTYKKNSRVGNARGSGKLVTGKQGSNVAFRSVETLFKNLGGIFRGLGGVLRGFSLGLLGIFPIALSIIAPIAAVGAVLYVLYKNCSQFREGIGNLTNYIEQKVTLFKNLPSVFFNGLLESVNSTAIGHRLLQALGFQVSVNAQGRATGIPRVPYDNFPALLHEGESVLTKRETNNMRNGMGSVSIAKLSDTIIVREDADIDRIANALVGRIKQAAINMA